VKRIGTSHTILVSVRTSDPNKSERIANAIGQVALQARVSTEQEGSRSPLLRERLQGLGPSAYVITTAGAAGRPDGPRKIIVIPGSLLFGLLVGAALALILDLMNRTVRTAAQVEHLGFECIGAIPRLRSGPPIGARQPAYARNPAEAAELRLNAMWDQTLRRTATAIAVSDARTIGVTSALGQEGATTIARGLAQTAALSRKTVLLVEANQSEPANGIAPNECAGLDVLRIDRTDGAHDATTWRTRCDPDRLGGYDLIVINLPSLESGPEFRMAAKGLDGILLVVKWGSTEFDRIERAIAASGVAPSEFIGAVLNMVDDRMIGTFGDKFWEAEAALVARRAPYEFSIPVERPAV